MIVIPKRIIESFELGIPDLYEDDNVIVETDEIGLTMVHKNQLNEEDK